MYTSNKYLDNDRMMTPKAIQWERNFQALLIYNILNTINPNIHSGSFETASVDYIKKVNQLPDSVQSTTLFIDYIRKNKKLVREYIYTQNSPLSVFSNLEANINAYGFSFAKVVNDKTPCELDLAEFTNAFFDVEKGALRTSISEGDKKELKDALTATLKAGINSDDTLGRSNER